MKNDVEENVSAHLENVNVTKVYSFNNIGFIVQRQQVLANSAADVADQIAQISRFRVLIVAINRFFTKNITNC